MAEWTTLDAFTETDYDTPELVRARTEVNKEIQSILDERQRIADSIAAVNSTPVEQLTVEQMSVARTAKEDSFRLLQRELALRKGAMTEFIKLQLQVAGEAFTTLQATIPDVEGAVIKDLEEIGYNPFDPKKSTSGSWDPGMVSAHPRVIEAHTKAKSLRGAATSYETQRLNQTLSNTIQADLLKVRNSLLVG